MKPNTQSFRAQRRAVISERRARIADLYIKKGLTVTKIAAMLGCGIGTVSEDMQALIAEWRREANVNMHAHIACLLKEIDADIERALDAYERSRKVKRVASVSKRSGLMGEETVANATQIERDEGDAKYLAIVAKCRELRLKILGAADAQDKEAKDTGKTATNLEDFVAQHHQQKQLTAPAVKQLPPHA